jgi:hypothetical protein
MPTVGALRCWPASDTRRPGAPAGTHWAAIVHPSLATAICPGAIHRVGGNAHRRRTARIGAGEVWWE